MSVMTVKIGTKVNGRVVFETDTSRPHKRGKYIAGFARNEEDAKRRAIAYAGSDVEFICCGAGDVMHNVEVSGLRGFSRRSARLPGWGS